MANEVANPYIRWPGPKDPSRPARPDGALTSVESAAANREMASGKSTGGYSSVADPINEALIALRQRR